MAIVLCVHQVSTLAIYSRALGKVIYQKILVNTASLRIIFTGITLFSWNDEDIMFFDKINCLSVNPKTLQFKRYNVARPIPTATLPALPIVKNRDGTLWVGDIGHAGFGKYNSRRELFSTDQPPADESILMRYFRYVFIVSTTPNHIS